MTAKTQKQQDLIILRTSPEVVTKSPRTRRQFDRILRRNLSAAFGRADLQFNASPHGSGYLISTDSVAAACAVLAHVFGVGSFSPVIGQCRATMDDICTVGAEVFSDLIAGKSYAVRARKMGGCKLSTRDIERELGAAINAFGTVNLSAPDVTAYVEANGDKAYLFTQREMGPRGLPVGTQGRALTLLSGGFDSPVAAWRAIRRGISTDFLLCRMGGQANERMVLQVAKVLCEMWVYGYRPHLYVIDFDTVVQDLREHVSPGYWQVVLKRLMYRAGCSVAERIGAEVLITGEAVGQVSSQTLLNLRAIEAVADRPVFRPLIGNDKQEIVDQARHIGTAPLSQRIQEFCALGASKPIVNARVEATDKEEEKLDLTLLDAALSVCKNIDILAVTPGDLRMPYLFADTIPDGAVVIDCQPKHLYARWHVPGARHMEPDILLKDFKKLEKSETYILYCPYGTQTPYLVEAMQQLGYESYAFRGGIKALQEALAAKDALEETVLAPQIA